MKKSISILVLLVLFFDSCSTKPNESPKIIEGKLVGVTLFVNYESKEIVTTATIKDSTDKFYEARFSSLDAEKLRNRVEQNFVHFEPAYFRIEKSNDKFYSYSVKEEAVLDYDFGKPARYIFPSDKKVVGLYLRDKF